MADQVTETTQTNNDVVTEKTEAVSTPAESTLLTSEKPAEVTPVEANKPEVKTETEGDKKPQEDGAPETYEAFKLEDGLTIQEGMLNKFQSVAKELNLSQDKAQKMIDLAIEHTKSLDNEIRTQFVETRKAWVNEIKTDKDFGGQKFTESLETAQRVLRKFGSPELTQFLTATGAGDNPEVFRLLTRIGKAISEDKLIDGKTTDAGPKSAAEVMYPTMQKK